MHSESSFLCCLGVATVVLVNEHLQFHNAYEKLLQRLILVKSSVSEMIVHFHFNTHNVTMRSFHIYVVISYKE